jgi:hypothetical protein
MVANLQIKFMLTGSMNTLQIKQRPLRELAIGKQVALVVLSNCQSFMMNI